MAVVAVLVASLSVTDEDSDAAMQRAIARLRADRACPHRVTEMPNRADDARSTLTPDGWVEIGVMADPDHSHDWRVWLNVQMGMGRLRGWAR